MRNLRLVLSYDGTDFHGWQIQPNAVTIQGEITKAVQNILGEKVVIYGSGRTDSGAHALAQVANFNINSNIPIRNLHKALNRHLPSSIRVHKIDEVPLDFHSRYKAISKTYQYSVWNKEICPPFLCRYVYHYTFPLNIELISQAASLFKGEFDFISFSASKKTKNNNDLEVQNTIRKIHRSRFYYKNDSSPLVYEVQGTGFLHHMVRNMVGTLLEVGRLKLKPNDVTRILSLKKRSEAGPTVAAKGLALASVEY